MCVICISEQGVKQPSRDLLWKMWVKNPHGAGYMFSRSNYVYIRKGFMTFNEYYDAIRAEHFTKDDTVIYHLRIATQGGINPEMTHPFMLTDDIRKTKVLRTRTNIGICHNGIISMTSAHDPEYSDTALFIAQYLSKIMDKPKDLKNKDLQAKIQRMIGSKMAILDYAGNVTLIGDFIEDMTGLVFSNRFFIPYSYFAA